MKKTMTLVFLSTLVSCAALAAPPKTGSAVAGKKAFISHCAVCHGMNADGKSQMANSFSTPIPDFRSKKVQSFTNDEIGHVISDGMGQMPAVAGVEDSEIPNLIAYVRTFGPKKKPAAK
jgi:mono/diheme cytochrome c family protein